METVNQQEEHELDLRGQLGELELEPHEQLAELEDPHVKAEPLQIHSHGLQQEVHIFL